MNQQRNNIAGIHNYCDRWCERCNFTSRCAVYESQEEESPEEQDINNKAFWDRLSQNFQNAAELLRQAAEAHGIDLEAIFELETKACEEKRLQTKQQVQNHPISRLASQYIKEASKLLEEQQPQYQPETIIRQVELGIKTEEDAITLLLEEKECLEVIQWYLHFIHVKFSRALSGKIEDTGWEKANGLQRDCDGSAKIGLIAVDRSLQAWAHLFLLAPGKEDEILPLLAILDQIRKLGQQEFPEAEAFVRPGFDTLV